MLTSLILAIGVSLDSFSAAMCSGLQDTDTKTHMRKSLIVAFCFGGFQALTPLLGYLLGGEVKGLIEGVDHWIAFTLLCVVGIKTIIASFSKDNETYQFSLKNVLMLSIATSIDAFIIGITLPFANVNAPLTIALFGIVTFIASFVGYHLGERSCSLFKGKISMAGGIVLIAIGIKILIEHL